jgi:hypothetical protein
MKTRKKIARIKKKSKLNRNVTTTVVIRRVQQDLNPEHYRPGANQDCGDKSFEDDSATLALEVKQFQLLNYLMRSLVLSI